MPISPEYRWLYPFDWRQLSAVIRFERAKGRCQRCRRPHGVLVFHLGDGRWWDAVESVWRNGDGRAMPRLSRIIASETIALLPTTRVILAAAHLDHDPANNRPNNLRAFCQRCHMLHDAAEHRRRRWLTLQRRKALGDLFLGKYPTTAPS